MLYFIFISLQLAVDAHIPEHLGGLDGEVVYIDTEGSFIVERMVDIATATVEHCHQIGNQGSNGKKALVKLVCQNLWLVCRGKQPGNTKHITSQEE